MKITKAELNREIEASHDQECMTERLAVMGCEIASAFLSRRDLGGNPESDKDEILSRFRDRLARKWRNLKTGNPHSYITAMINSSVRDYYRRRNSHQRKLGNYALEEQKTMQEDIRMGDVKLEAYGRIAEFLDRLDALRELKAIETGKWRVLERALQKELKESRENLRGGLLQQALPGMGRK